MFENNALGRPGHLPDFKTPPLNEVVVGMQFSSPQGYQQIRSGEVWNLFKQNYPQVQEFPPLPPTFETFGLPYQHSTMPQFSIMTGGTHDRFWFLRPDGSELIQFQQDRLLHNWRKVVDGTNSYPRFESMISEFGSELAQLQDYMASLVPQALIINQCEISYINHIKFNRSESKSFSEWLRFVNFPDGRPDDFNINFREVISGDDQKPLGRFFVEAALGYLPDGQEIIVLSLTVKGAPIGTDIKSGLRFLTLGREVIVQRFAELTTDEAHKKWKRVN
jgi:uncharacterized protein (TIGR04255 family)